MGFADGNAVGDRLSDAAIGGAGEMHAPGIGPQSAAPGHPTALPLLHAGFLGTPHTIMSLCIAVAGD